ncbi:MAG TPA: 2Fe-2S iron-sulfur cluster-binding protein [Candidatus Dormibacteraeota bacterium]|nr:2Fe-2S iron-sulfur cluster-binding protein [Candidatus Dormibacteraeota bacterium]
MNYVLHIDGQPVEVSPGATVLDAARKLGLDIPTLCFLEKCGPLNSCLVCLVKLKGKLVPACGLKAEPGMVVESETHEVHEARRTALELLFSEHVGDCLSPCHRLCPLRMNIPVMLRQVQAQKLPDAVVTVKDALPLPGVLSRLCHHPCEQGCRRANWDDPAAIREVERMVADYDAEGTAWLPPKKPATGKCVVIIGAGPAGLAAAFHLLRQGHACTISDRHSSPGGTLRAEIQKQTLEGFVLQRDLAQLERLGAQFKLGVALGTDVTVEGLLRGFDAVLLALGETSKEEGENLGLEMGATGIKANPESYQTRQPAVFAAGRAVRHINQLIRAMSEGVAAAECIHNFLLAKPVQRPEKPFSSIMGPVKQNELEKLMHNADAIRRLSPCDLCSGFTPQEARTEASRCLHCDCRSSGNCALQTYAQRYQADASRYRHQRPAFEQQVQPGGIIFEPGKCILCGICVRLTELAREPLGLTFIGRGFNVRVAAPFNRTIQAGLQKVGRECVVHCPTGALTEE